ncbi:hypothetical protein [Rhodobacter calidifons]|uniref:Uncharacterized protein n=1 Tax=Rhodobacter calidifons TaxID=2715277 RepID=A0ABX0GB97_9RHOB|nr:hypothetical protein [Rhodobacter calidifons]NHB78605.1 hypothetical protein [Rhodobacter calidifons]
MSVTARGEPCEGSALRRAAARLWHARRIRRLVQALLGADAVVIVNELPCTQAACPGPATQITILGFDMSRRVLLIHRPTSEVAAADLSQLLR